MPINNFYWFVASVNSLFTVLAPYMNILLKDAYLPDLLNIAQLIACFYNDFNPLFTVCCIQFTVHHLCPLTTSYVVPGYGNMWILHNDFTQIQSPCFVFSVWEQGFCIINYMRRFLNVFSLYRDMPLASMLPVLHQLYSGPAFPVSKVLEARHCIRNFRFYLRCYFCGLQTSGGSIIVICFIT